MQLVRKVLHMELGIANKNRRKRRYSEPNETKQRTPWWAACEAGTKADVDEQGGEEDRWTAMVETTRAACEGGGAPAKRRSY